MNTVNLPLNALRAFEAAARHQSFTAAAAELNVSQVAISRHVKALEAYLEVPLFIRSNRTIALTDNGRRLMPALTQGFDVIQSAVRQTTMRGRKDVVSLQAYTTFAQRWLIPRLPDFHARHPEIEVRISASLAPVDFTTSHLHAAIRSGKGHFPDCHATRILGITLVPVCSPRYLAQLPDLMAKKSVTLLDCLAREEDWRIWMSQTETTRLAAMRRMKFESSALCYHAAAQSLGIAMGISALVEDEIAAGNLVKAFPQSLPLDSGYYLIWPRERALHGGARTFHEWLLQEASAA